MENKAIRAALADRHRVNRAFDLLGLTYSDWSQVESTEAEGGKKRKMLEMSVKTMGLLKRGGHGWGCSVAPKVTRVAAAKVPPSSISSPVVAS